MLIDIAVIIKTVVLITPNCNVYGFIVSVVAIVIIAIIIIIVIIIIVVVVVVVIFSSYSLISSKVASAE